MITSESNNTDFHKFFEDNKEELARRLKGLLNNKYKRQFIHLSKIGKDIPPVFGMLKLENATLYVLPIGLKYTKIGFQMVNMSCFLIMKDLRKQTQILVTESRPSTIMFSAHAIRRYKERLGLDPNLDFVDVCKHMIVARCGAPKVLAEMNQVYGTNPNRRVVRLYCTTGTFFGYYYSETDMLYADTFLTSNEFREDQEYMDVNKNERFQNWKDIQESYGKGELSYEEFINNLDLIGPRVAIENGKIKYLTPSEITEEDERLMQEDPLRFEKQAEANRSKVYNKLKRKGYK